MAFSTTRIIRFEDVDYAQVVFFPNIFVICHNVFEDFFAAEVGTPYAKMLGERRVAFPSVHAEADFKAPMRFGDLIRVELAVVSVGRSSVRARYRLYSEGAGSLNAEVVVVTAAVSLESFTPVELPADVRRAFEAHLIEN